MKPIQALSLLAFLFVGTAWSLPDEPEKTSASPAASQADAAAIREQLPSYPLTTCVVSGEPLDAMGGPLDVVRDGKLVRLCCKGCVKALDKDPAASLAKIEQAVVEAQKPSYPLETCVVSGEPLGAMGEPIERVHGTRLVRLCCKGCVKPFAKDPAKFVKKVDEALIAAQTADYPHETCPISGHSLLEPYDVLYGTRLVRLCCEDCRAGFEKAPEKALEKLAAAGK